MIRRIAAAIRAIRTPPPPASRPLGPLPESVKELARRRSPFAQNKKPSPFPLRDASGMTWAECARRRAEQEQN